MTFRLSTTEISEDIGQSLGTALRDRFGDLSSPAKRLARILGISEPTARGMLAGKLPATPIFLQALDALGPKIAAGVLERLIGKQEASTARLHAVETSLRELAEHVEAIRNGNAAGRARMAGLLGFRSGRADDEGGAPVRVAAAQAEPAGRLDRAQVAVISARRPLDEVAGLENLRRQVSDWHARVGRLEVDAALAYAKSDPLKRTGVAIRKPGAAWLLAHQAESHPLKDIPADPVQMAREFDATAADDRPWLLDTGAAFLSASGVTATANWVCRTVDRARDGTLILMAGFSPKVAA